MPSFVNRSKAARGFVSTTQDILLASSQAQPILTDPNTLPLSPFVLNCLFSHGKNQTWEREYLRPDISIWGDGRRKRPGLPWASSSLLILPSALRIRKVAGRMVHLKAGQMRCDAVGNQLYRVALSNIDENMDILFLYAALKPTFCGSWR